MSTLKSKTILEMLAVWKLMVTGVSAGFKSHPDDGQ